MVKPGFNGGKPGVIDLFCGCGGLSYGFREAGYNILFGIDNWQDALETFKLNHPGSLTCLADLYSADPGVLTRRYGIGPGDIHVVIGGPPCQGFSVAGKRKADDPRNRLYTAFARFVDYFRPTAFVMENVPTILSAGEGMVLERIVGEFERAGYTVTYKVMLSADYGVPQNRRRAVFVGLRGEVPFEFPKTPHGMGKRPYVTVKEAISDLPEGSIREGGPYKRNAYSLYQRNMRKGSSGVYNHQATRHTETTKGIIALVPEGRNYKVLPAHLRNTRRVNIAWTRMSSGKPSFTIDTGHNHHFHYAYNRVPTVRESARLQSFPDTFIFAGGKTSQLRQVGNAVPPLFAEALAKKLMGYLR